MRRIWIAVFAALLVCIAAVVVLRAPSSGSPPLVLAAASLQESLNAAADSWVRQGHERPVLSFAGSSALARQIEAGAPADLFISADEKWMDQLEQKGNIIDTTRETFLGNQLVLVAPRSHHQRVEMTPAGLSKALTVGAVAMADVGAVPAGRYGKAALESLGIWDRVAPHVVQAENVRAALSLVERGAAPWGIVYATDARASDKVMLAGIFPPTSHPPIRYPIARITGAKNPQAEAFRQFLVSPAAKPIFAHYGFVPL